MSGAQWDPGAYDSSHRYVFDAGRDLVAVLNPRPGERILDVGCGTGHLTAQIAESGADVLGIDSSPSMLAQARQNYPKLRFHLTDLRGFQDDKPYDAVFSNAVLHWIQPPESAVRPIRNALKPGGRFVAELGARGNMAAVTQAAGRNDWYFPTVGEYATLLERHGFRVTAAWCFERPTPVEGEAGLREWLSMFFKPELAPETITRMERDLRPALFHDGAWIMPYIRLRMVAIVP